MTFRIKQLFAQACMRQGAVLFGSFARQLLFGEESYLSTDVELYLEGEGKTLEEAKEAIIRLLASTEQASEFYCNEARLLVAINNDYVRAAFPISYKEKAMQVNVFYAQVFCFMQPESDIHIGCSLEAFYVRWRNNSLVMEMRSNGTMRPLIKPMDILEHLQNEETIINETELKTPEEKQQWAPSLADAFEAWHTCAKKQLAPYVSVSHLQALVLLYSDLAWPYAIPMHLLNLAKKMRRQEINILNRGQLPELLLLEDA